MIRASEWRAAPALMVPPANVSVNDSGAASMT